MAKKILLVDDDPNICMMLGDFLVAEGYEVTQVHSGEEALGCLAEIKPDLIILDMGMPGMGGTGFIEHISNASGHLIAPVLVLTARGEMAEYFATKHIAGFITKPAAPDELLAEVQRILFVESDLPHDEPFLLGQNPRRVLVLAEPNHIRANAYREALGKVGFSVEAVRTGPEAIETTIALHPAGLILPMDAELLSADAVLEILRKLPSSKALPVIVYNAEKSPERWLFIDPRNVTKVNGMEGQDIAQAALKNILK
ncbi:MAG: response regulator [bacterium]|nr:response regulator [bacterium]MDO5462006.1 response regulator [bacterium]